MAYRSLEFCTTEFVDGNWLMADCYFQHCGNVKYWRSWCNLFEFRHYASPFSSLLPSAQLSVVFLFCALSFCSLFPPASSLLSFLLRLFDALFTCEHQPIVKWVLVCLYCAGGGGTLRLSLNPLVSLWHVINSRMFLAKVHT